MTLGTHIQKEHSQIPQFDGLEKSSIKEVDHSPLICKECEFTSTLVKDMEDHIDTEHQIKPVERPPEVKKPPAIAMSAEERKLESDFIRTFVLTSTMGKSDMRCNKCKNQWFNRIDFKNHMNNSHDKNIFIDIK